MVKEHENIFVTRTLSKSYALAGIRFGFLVAQPHVIAELTKIKDSYNCDSVSIAAATAAVGAQAWLQDCRRKIIETRQRAAQELRDLGFDVLESHANFLWCTRSDQPLEPLYQQLKEHQILVRYMQYASWGEGLRITIGTDAQVDAALVVMKRLLG